MMAMVNKNTVNREIFASHFFLASLTLIVRWMNFNVSDNLSLKYNFVWVNSRRGKTINK